MTILTIRRRALCSAILWATLAIGPASAQGIDAQKVLAQSDQIRNPQGAFSVEVHIADYEAGKLVDSSQLKTYSKAAEADGKVSTLVAFTAPARDAGKLLLKAGVDLWYFDPNSRVSTRISPQQRLAGQASNGDVLTINFARDYKAEFVREESITDGERKPRNTTLLRLQAAAEDATYAQAELWLDSSSHAPVKARFFAESGRTLKTAFYRRYQQQLGMSRPTEIVIIDGVNPGAVTVVRMVDYQQRRLPNNWFQREFLPRFQPE